MRFDMLPDATDPDAAAGTLARSGVPCAQPSSFFEGFAKVCNLGER